MAYFESHKIKQLAALSAIVILGIFLLITLSGFIPAFLGSVIFYIICSPVIHFFTEKTKMKRGLAVVIVLILSLLVIVIPAFGLSYLLVSKVSSMLSGSHNFIVEIQNLNEKINANY